MTGQHGINKALLHVLEYAEGEGYAGYSKFDALNSHTIKRLAGNSRWLRFLFTQAVMRSPCNLRPMLGVEKSINPKGMALFAMAYLNEFKRTGSGKARDQAVKCLDWLLSIGVVSSYGVGWGYNFDWQSTLFFVPKYCPNAIVTVLCGEAFIKAFEVLDDDKYLLAAQRAALYLRCDLPVLVDAGHELCIAYVSVPVKSIVLNINASAGALIAKVGKYLTDTKLMNDAHRMISFVVNRRTPYYAWYYTYPAGNSYIVHDNYHTGGIVDALRDYEVYTGDGRFQDVYSKALEYYSYQLFLDNGAPKYMNNRIYPFDIHGAAQGIISFSKAASFDRRYLHQGDRVAGWTIENMRDVEKGFFYYQKGRMLTKRFTLMRWCNAWMAKALSDLLLAHQAFS